MVAFLVTTIEIDPSIVGSLGLVIYFFVTGEMKDLARILVLNMHLVMRRSNVHKVRICYV
jgi:hypothetical protein